MVVEFWEVAGKYAGFGWASLTDGSRSEAIPARLVGARNTELQAFVFGSCEVDGGENWNVAVRNQQSHVDLILISLDHVSDLTNHVLGELIFVGNLIGVGSLWLNLGAS